MSASTREQYAHGRRRWTSALLGLGLTTAALTTGVAGAPAATAAPVPPGDVIAWDNSGNALTVPDTAASGVTAIAAGQFHNLALKNNGSVVAWDHGGNARPVPTTAASDVTAIAAGHFHNLAIVNPEPPATVTVTASSHTLPYGKPLPTPAYTVTGLRDGDTLTTQPTCTVNGALQQLTTFTHTCTGAQANGNDDLDYLPGTVTVTKAATALTLRPLGHARATPRATLRRSHDHQPLAGQMVRFRTNGKLVCRDRTDADGVATCARVKVTRVLRATYPGAPRYLVSRDTAVAARR